MTLLIPYLKDTAYKGIECHYAIMAARKYLPITQVVTAGDPHKDADACIAVKQSGTKQYSIVQKIKAACDSGIVTDPFICMSDDVFMLKPVTAIPYWHCGMLVHWYNSGSYAPRCSNTLAHGARFNFDNHAPIVYHKQLFIDRVVKPFETGKDYLIQSLYAMNEPGEYLPSLKFNKLLPYADVMTAIEGQVRFSTGPSGVTNAMREVWAKLYD